MIKLGFISSIMDWADWREVLDMACRLNYNCVELACWPREKAERRYAGVSHFDVANLTARQAEEIRAYSGEKGVTISALAYYPNVMDENGESAQNARTHLLRVIDAAELLGVDMVTTFIGRDQRKSVEENLDMLVPVWRPILAYARKKGVRIAIENCPMLFGEEQWPGGQNLMTTPALWGRVFELLPDPNLGINYDPSHFVWQMVDYIEPIRQYKERIFHVHFKDIKLYRQKLNHVGTMAYPLEYMAPKLPGLGDVDWGNYVSALLDVGYDGYGCVEVEDRAYESSREDVVRALELSKRYLTQFI